MRHQRHFDSHKKENSQNRKWYRSALFFLLPTLPENKFDSRSVKLPRSLGRVGVTKTSVLSVDTFVFRCK